MPLSTTVPFLAEVIFIGYARVYGDITSPILPFISDAELPLGCRFYALCNGLYYVGISERLEPREKFLECEKLDEITYSKMLKVSVGVDTKGCVESATITAQEWDYGPTEPAQLRCVVYDLYNPPNPQFTFYLYRKYSGGFKVYDANGVPMYSYDSGYGSHYLFPLSGQGDWGIVRSTVLTINIGGTSEYLRRIQMYNATWLTWWPYTKEGPTGDWELQKYPGELSTSKRVWGLYWCVNSPSPFSLNWRWPYEGIPCWSEHGGVNSYMIAYPEGVAP